MKKIIYTVFSYLSAFTYGAYTYGYLHGHKPQIHQWIITGVFGIMFYIMSQEKNKK
jgi:uncharacterized membrane protein